MNARTKAATCLLAAVIGTGLFHPVRAADPGPPYLATGIKIGEVTDTTAIVWTRLTRRAERNASDGPMIEIQFAADKKAKKRSTQVERIVYPQGASVADLRDAVPGAPGEVRVRYRAADNGDWQETDWQAVDPDRDYTHSFSLTGLRPNTSYLVQVDCRGPGGGSLGESLAGRFRTAPAVDDPARVVFTVSTGQHVPDKDRPDGFKIYPAMLNLDPSFFVHTGDIVYYDALAKDISLARYHWQRTYGLPTNVDGDLLHEDQLLAR